MSTFANLLNPPATPGNLATRPDSGDATFRDISLSPSADDDENRTILAAAHAPGDHALPIPYACNTPSKLLKWLLDSFIVEQNLATTSNPRVVTRTVVPTGTNNRFIQTYQVTLTLDLDSEVLDPTQIVEPTFTYPG